MSDRERIVAVGLLTAGEVAAFGQRLTALYRLDRDHEFEELLHAIDAAEERRIASRAAMPGTS